MLQQPSVEALHAVAGRLAPGRDRQASWHTRLHDPIARAAFALWSWRSVHFTEDQVPCERCGLVTAAFCGGCDFRARDAGTGNPAPVAICTTCDRGHLTCTSCTSVGLTGPVAELRHLQQYPGVHLGREVVVYGYADESGTFIRLPEPRSFALSPEELQEIHRGR